MRNVDSPWARPRWADLGWRARAWRLLHVAWAGAQLGCLARVWRAALRRERAPAGRTAAAFLGVEGAALVVGRGNCPIGPRQVAWGDPVPFFELVLPPRAAKLAIPVLALVSLGGILLLALRQAERASVSGGPSRTAGRPRRRGRA